MSVIRRFGGAALEYKKEGAPLAVSGISLWDNRKMKECEGLPDGLITGKCELGPFFSCNGMLMFQEFEASEYVKVLTPSLKFYSFLRGVAHE